MMTQESDNRNIQRDSLFVMADLRVPGDPAEHRIKVRNLSAGGMMGEGVVKVFRGSLVTVSLRNIGPVEGTIAWVQDNRFGIAFRDDIDPLKVRAQPDDGDKSQPSYLRQIGGAADRSRNLRKI